MIENVKPSLPIPHLSAREFVKKPIVVLLALTALSALVGYVVRKLWGRIQIHPTPEQLFSDGMNAYKDGDYPKAITIFKWALSRNPDQELQTKIHVLRAQCYRSIKKFDKALKDYESVEKSPTHNDEQLLKVYEGRADIFSQEGVFERAAAACFYALKLKGLDNQKKAELLLIYGFSLYSMGIYEQAIESFDAAEKLGLSDDDLLSQILGHRIKAYLKRNQPGEALEDLKKVRLLNQTFVNIRAAFMELGQIYGNIGKESQAMECWSLALECQTLSPTERAEVLYYRGCFHKDKKKPSFRDALADFRQACNLDSKVKPNLEALSCWMCGLVCHEDKNDKMAIEQLKQAVDLNPSNKILPAILVNLGQLLLAMDCNEAIKNYSKAIRLGIEGEVLATVLFYRSEAYLKDKNFAMAKLDCVEALSCVFENQELRQKLQDLQKTLKGLS